MLIIYSMIFDITKYQHIKEIYSLMTLQKAKKHFAFVDTLSLGNLSAMFVIPARSGGKIPQITGYVIT